MNSAHVLISLVVVLGIIDTTPTDPFTMTDDGQFAMRQDGGWAPPSPNPSPIYTTRIEPVPPKKRLTRKNEAGKKKRGPRTTASPSTTPLFTSNESSEPLAESFDDNWPYVSPSPQESLGPVSYPDIVDGASSEFCVDVSHLSSHPRHDLVHLQDFFAPVYCPVASSLPCGTADHLLVVSGSPMSCCEYCDSVLCVERLTLVNSVLSHIWRDELHHGNVQLTMYDVRHPAVMQKVLHRAISASRLLFQVGVPRWGTE